MGLVYYPDANRTRIVRNPAGIRLPQRGLKRLTGAFVSLAGTPYRLLPVDATNPPDTMAVCGGAN